MKKNDKRYKEYIFFDKTFTKFKLKSDVKLPYFPLSGNNGK